MSCAVVELLLPADPAPPLERKDPMQLPRAVHRPGSLLGSRAFYFLRYHRIFPIAALIVDLRFSHPGSFTN